MSQGSPRTGTAELNIGFVSLITVRSMDRGNSEHTEHSVRVEVRTCLSVPADAAEALRLPPFCQLNGVPAHASHAHIQFQGQGAFISCCVSV